MEKPIDATDYAILACLKDNARMKASDIGKQINLSVSAVLERMKKMELSGLIEGYTIQLNQKMLGNDLVAFMNVTLEHLKYYDDFVAMVRENGSIQSCYYLAGTYDFMLKILADSSESLERIHRNIKSFAGVSAMETHFVLKTVKSDTATLPEDETLGMRVK